MACASPGILVDTAFGSNGEKRPFRPGLLSPSASRLHHKNCGKDAGCASLENASRFPLSHSLDGCEKAATSVVLENPNPEKVSLSVD